MFIEFCLPIYNEEKILEKNAIKLLNFCREKNFLFSWKIIIIINGSNDQSLEISKNLKNKYSDKINFVNYKTGGRGYALKKYYLESEADVLVYMDIDLAVSLDNTKDLLRPFLENKADLAIGSRLLAQSKIDRSLLRELSSQGYNFLSRIILNHKFSDLQCGFKAIKKDAFLKIAPYIKDEKWFFDTEIIMFAKVFNYQVAEIPVDWSENRYEERKSKVKVIRDGCKFILNLIELKKRIAKINRLKNNQ